MQVEVYTAAANGKLTPYNPKAQEKLTINTVYGRQGSAILASESFFVGEITEDDYTDYDWRYLKAAKKQGSLGAQYILIVMDWEAEAVLESAISKRGNAYYYINPLKQDSGSGGSGGTGSSWAQILLDIGKQVAKEIDLKDIIGGSGGGGGTGTGSSGAPDGGWGSGTGSGGGTGSSGDVYQNWTSSSREGQAAAIEEPGGKLPAATIVGGVALLALMGYIAFR